MHDISRGNLRGWAELTVTGWKAIVGTMMDAKLFLRFLNDCGRRRRVNYRVCNYSGAPAVNFGLQQLKSKLEDASLAGRHKALNDHWTEHVSHVEKRVASLNQEYDKVRKKKLRYLSCAYLGEKIKTALKDVIEILDKCPNEIFAKGPKRVIKEPGVSSIAEYSTLQNAFQKILTLLQNDGVKCVALHGQKGVGKTTIIQNINNHFYDNDNKVFDIVIFIKLPSDKKTGDLHILQKITDRIKVNKEDDKHEVDEGTVAQNIQSVLEDKRYLLILDGVRSPPDGIWEKLDISAHKKSGKMVITTYFPLALSSKHVDSKVVLERLPPEEAQAMFQNIYGEALPPHAEQLCDRFCCCLPLLIAPIAKSFVYQESPPDWERVLKECTPWPQIEVDGLEELYSILQICYQQLGDPSAQKCFLYASLYPANSKISTNYFLECCIAQGFLSDVVADTKYSEIRGQGIKKLKQLVKAAFLEEGEQMRYVKMNDIYRQLALRISFNYSDSESKMYVDNGEHRETSGSASRQDAKWVSMIGSKRDSLPANQSYRSLQTLLLQKNLELVQIPLNVFQSMGSLLVLNLYRTKISELPSLSGLTNLKVFYINRCSGLKIFPNQIKPLKHLEVFDIRDTKVDFVPPLNSLRCLRISYIESSNCLGLSKLHGLEELTVEVTSLERWCEDAKNIISQVASLKNLTFKCNFPFSEITLTKLLGTNEARIDWVRALINCKPPPQVGVRGLSPTKAREMFQDIVKVKQALPRDGESSSNLPITSSANRAGGLATTLRNLSLGSDVKA
ncbi:probable disease resistance protein At1g15890 [Neltuma alba]|uniref:probable disease resistance protein At1g15890 n=1 Tax=Neltuma alba TaxID=207710 RepID=UPI0010A3988A|nr:probable disease resistance protein At1g15890 [Prosopis alba]